MHSPDVIRQINELLQEGQHSRRKIAKIAGVACATVSAVATGGRQAEDYLKRALAPKPSRKSGRCPSCGAQVQMPCKLCQTRKLVAGGQLPPPEPVVAAPIGLDLNPEHQARYAEVRRWRREALRLGVITMPHSNSDAEPVPPDSCPLVPPCPQETNNSL